MSRVSVLLVCAVLAGCAFRSHEVPERAGGRRTISEGYSLLHYAVSEQRWLDEAVLVKRKSEPVSRIVERIAKNARDLEGKLEDMAKRYPAIHLEPPPPSEIEQRARQAQYKGQLKRMLLAEQAEFERQLLLSQHDVLDLLRHLAGVMVEAETDANRRSFWTDVQREFEDEYRDVTRLLEREHFRAVKKE